MKSFGLVIFDSDGVLVDSEVITSRVFAAMLNERGIPGTAGVAAGMTVYGYWAHTPAHRLVAAGAHHTFDRMSDLPAILGNSKQPHDG